MRTLLLTLGVSLFAALSAGCGGGGEAATSTGGSDTTTGTGGGNTTTGTGGTGGTGGAPTADPSKGAWRGGFGTPGLAGFASRANAIVHGADGNLYVGGIFEDAAGTPANNVAVWTGSAWKALGDGLPGAVDALAFGADGALYAGGAFATASDPANHLARWDGSQWTMLPGEVQGDIHAIAVQGSRLLVGGTFSDVAGLGTAGIAAHDASGWAAIGTTGADFEVNTILVTDAQGFCIGGAFSSVDGVPAANAACWDAAAWAQMGDGLPGAVARLAAGPDGKYYAGGQLTFVVDPTTGDYNASIAVLQGQSWQPFAGGIDNGFINEVRAIAFAPDGDLLIGGTFGTAGHAAPVQALNLARYDFATKTWSELGGGADNAVGVSLGSVVGVNDILVLDDGAFVVGGLYSSVSDGTVQAANVGRLEGSSWSTMVNAGTSYLGVGGLINSLAADPQGRLVAGGYFPAAGGVRASNLARLGDKGWEALGEGVDGVVFDVHVRPNGDVLAGGNFSHAGAVAAPFLARWDGSKWSAVGGALDGQVSAIAEDTKGNVYVGGDLVSAGSVTVNHVARWDGSVWSALGQGFDGRVTSIAVDASGHVIAVGLFHNAGNLAVNGLAAWDGTTWKGFGGGFDGGDFEYGSRVIADGTGFIVSGAFTAIDGHPFSGVARWDGEQWTGFGKGLSSSQGSGVIVTDVVRYGDGLFATGTFDTSDGAALSYIGWFDGAAWRPLATGLDDLGERLLLEGDTLWAGGSFLTAGGRISTGIGAWDFGK